MLNKISILKFLKSEFSIALSTTTFTTALHMLAGVLINKILAITIGPGGIAMLGQFTSFKDITTTIANGSFGQGVTKYIADPLTNNQKVIATSNLFTLIISSFIGILSISFSLSLSGLLFKSNEYALVFVVFGLTMPFFAINNLLISTINGYRNFGVLAKIKLANSFVALILSGSLAWIFLLKGALMAQAINTSIVFIISFALIYQSRNVYLSFSWSMFDKEILKKLLAFTSMGLTSALLKPFVLLFIRDYIITNAGDYDAGIWEATRRLSDYYNQIITVALAAYYLPKLSSLHSSIDLKSEIFNGMKVVLPLFFMMAVIIYMMKGWMISLLFSAEFSSMKDLILPQLIGDFFMIFSFLIAYMMIAKAMVKAFMISQIMFYCFFVFIGLLLFEIIGIKGVIWANTVSYFLYSCFLIFYFRKILFLNES
jgi:polysaccharide transporter, PST family